MDLTPGEKAVLGQIRVLYSGAAQRDQQLKALMMQWPPTQYETYKSAFGRLLAKQLIKDTGSQIFQITDAGLRAMGVAVLKPLAQVRVQQRPNQQANSHQAAQQQSSRPVSRIRGALSRLWTANG
jgi:hypothetical protein